MTVLPSELRLQVYVPVGATPARFVQLWASQYDSPYDDVYERYLRQQPLAEEGILALFGWKNGGPLSARKRASVKQNYVERLTDVRQLPPGISAEQFLRLFAEGGAIWRIFWLHCCKPDEFAIYDQHVHRAMTMIQGGTAAEIPTADGRKVEQYLNRYLPFHRQFSDQPPRDVDRALWVYGKFLKKSRWPGAQGGNRGNTLG